MPGEIHPDDLSSRSFPNSFRGYDQAEVRAFLRQSAETLRQVLDQRDRLAARLGELGERDLQTEYAAVGREVAEVLEAARRAAEAMRERAATDAARWRAEAMAEAEAERRQAKLDSENLRGDAWSTSVQLLDQVHKEVAGIRAASERDSITVRGSAEREAHRLTATARRESDDLMRAARMEAERASIEAGARHDEIIEGARRQAETAQERARALEQRREELLSELENLRSTLTRMEGELDERRHALGLSIRSEDEPGARVTRASLSHPHSDARWEPGETIRIIPSKGEPPPVPPPDALEMAAEVRRLREEIAAAEAPDTQPTIEAVPTQPPDELGDIFRRLRGPEEAVPSPAPDQAAVTVAPKPEMPAPPATDPFALRERLLLPITNRALRAVKRQLTEEQNLALEEIRVKESGWQPSEAAIRERLRADLVILVSESFAAGHVAAEELAGTQLPRPATRSRDVDGIASALTAALTQVISQEAGPGRQVGAAASRVFRSWRTDEAERRVLDLANASYHDGLANSLPGALTWVVAGRGCASCRAAGEDRGELLPPNHPGCLCTVAPVTR